MCIRRVMLSLCLLISLSFSATSQQQQSTTTITILQLNDVYEISPVDGGENGGLARVATRIKQERARSKNTLFLLAGDFVSPSLASKEFKGEQMIDSLNAIGLDIAVLGNHEFDIDLKTLGQRIGESRFEYTAANVFDKQTGKPLRGVKPYIIREIGGVRVAIFGLLTAETAEKATYGKEVEIRPPVPAGVRVARQLRREGADLVIAVTHLSMCDDKALAAQADIDLIVGGHEHELLQSMAGRTHISKMGSDARNLGRIDLHLTRLQPLRRFRLRDIDWWSLPVNKNIEEDAAAKAVVARWEAKLKAKYPDLDERVGATTVELDVIASHLRRGETNLGNFFADAYRQGFGELADGAMLNSGGIRSDTTYGRDGMTTNLTNKDIRSILPYDNNLVQIRLKGSDIKQLLEHGVAKVGEEDGRFPQVSGISFTYDPAKPEGQRITRINIGDKPYQPDTSYTLVVNSYMFDQKGDGYDFSALSDVKRLSQRGLEPLERDIVIKLIKDKQVISPKTEGRITSTQQQTPVLDPCAASIPRARSVRNTRRSGAIRSPGSAKFPRDRRSGETRHLARGALKRPVGYVDSGSI